MSTVPSIPTGEGTPRGFKPTMKPAEVVRQLRQMLAKMTLADTEDASSGKQINQERRGYEQAITEALYLANAARFTGQVPGHWAPNVGTQPTLPLPADAGPSQPVQQTN